MALSRVNKSADDYRVIMMSDYYGTLASENLKRGYVEKVKFVNCDPYYLLAEGNFSINIESYLPRVRYLDLLNYLVLQHHFYTGQQFREMEKLEAYRFIYKAGFISKLNFTQRGEYFIVLAEVRYNNN